MKDAYARGMGSVDDQNQSKWLGLTVNRNTSTVPLRRLEGYRTLRAEVQGKIGVS
jgi:hypothetical protein